jgi:hypothetical protein
MRALGFLFLVVLVVAGVGWWRGWFVVDASQRSQPRVSIDREKVAGDAAGAAAKVEALTDRAVAAFKSRSQPAPDGNGAIEVAATLVRANASANSVDLRVGEEVFTAGIGSEVAILVDGRRASLGELRSAAAVTLRLMPTADGTSLRITTLVQ